MRRYDVETVEIRQVRWETGYWPWAMRRAGDVVELERDLQVVLRISEEELFALRDAIDALLPAAPPEATWPWGHRLDPRPYDLPDRVGQPWSAREEARLAELFAEGHRARDIAALLARSESGVGARLRQMGLRREPVVAGSSGGGDRLLT